MSEFRHSQGLLTCTFLKGKDCVICSEATCTNSLEYY